MFPNRITRFVVSLLFLFAATTAHSGLGTDRTNGIDEGGTYGIDEGGTYGIDEGGTDAVLTGAIQTNPLSLNGVRIDFRSADITRDGQPLSAHDIRHGQIATVAGNLSRKTLIADSVSLTSRLTGQIEKYDILSGTISLLGHTVFMDSATAMGISMDALTAGSWIVVDGLLLDGAGAIQATRIDAATTREFELAGPVSAADSTRLSFSIGNQRIEFSTAGLLDLPTGTPQAGQNIRVTGDLTPDGDVVRARIVRETQR